MKRFFIWLLAIVGVFFGIVWYFDVYQAGEDWSDFFSDPVGGTQSLFSRFSLWVSGLWEQAAGATGGTVNPRTLAAGLIAGFEGFVPHAYPDPKGQSTTYSIGYGHQIKQGDGFGLDSTISEGDAIALLSADLDTYATCVDNAVTVPLSPQQTAALYSLCYNIGCTRFQGSTLLRNLNAGQYDAAAGQFAVWNIANGAVSDALVSRRAKEADLFSSNPIAAPAETQSADASITDELPDDSGA
jgi:lysozyme